MKPLKKFYEEALESIKISVDHASRINEILVSQGYSDVNETTLGKIKFHFNDIYVQGRIINDDPHYTFAHKLDITREAAKELAMRIHLNSSFLQNISHG